MKGGEARDSRSEMSGSDGSPSRAKTYCEEDEERVEREEGGAPRLRPTPATLRAAEEEEEEEEECETPTAESGAGGGAMRIAALERRAEDCGSESSKTSGFEAGAGKGSSPVDIWFVRCALFVNRRGQVEVKEIVYRKRGPVLFAGCGVR